MSQRLQRFAVRMLYDPSLVERIYSGLPVDGLRPAERRLRIYLKHIFLRLLMGSCKATMIRLQYRSIQL